MELDREAPPPRPIVPRRARAPVTIEARALPARRPQGLRALAATIGALAVAALATGLLWASPAPVKVLRDLVLETLAEPAAKR